MGLSSRNLYEAFVCGDMDLLFTDGTLSPSTLMSFDVFEEVLGSRTVVKMPWLFQLCTKSTTSNLLSSSKSPHADSSDSNGNTDSLPKEGKNKTKKAKAGEPAQKKAVESN